MDVGGHRLHLDRRGAGGPTVVLEAARGRPSLDWLLVAPELGRNGRVCAYDRAGLGWSDPGPEPRTAARLPVYRDLQAAAARLSPHGAQIIAAAADGPLPLTAPASVVSAVRSVLDRP